MWGLVSELFGAFLPWAALGHPFSPRVKDSRKATISHHRPISQRPGRGGWEWGWAGVKRAPIDSSCRWGIILSRPLSSSWVQTCCCPWQAPLVGAPLLPPSLQLLLQNEPVPLTQLKSGPYSPLSPGTKHCFPLAPLISDFTPWHPQGRELRAGLQRLEGLSQIPALPLASWVVSGK